MSDAHLFAIWLL